MWLLLGLILLVIALVFRSVAPGGPVVLTLFSVGLLCLAWGILGYFRERAWRAESRQRKVWVRRRSVSTSWDGVPLTDHWLTVGPEPADVELEFDPRPTQHDDPYA